MAGGPAAAETRSVRQRGAVVRARHFQSAAADLTRPWGRSLALTLLVLAGSPACSLFRDDTFDGHYTASFEASLFRPCGSTEDWWASGGLGAVRDFQGRTDTVNGEGTAFVQWRGKVSGRGHYGHLGAYDREITVTEVLHVRSVSPSDCR